MTLLSIPTQFNTVNTQAELAEIVKNNYKGLPSSRNDSLPTQGLNYKTFAFNRGYSNIENVNSYSKSIVRDKEVEDAILSNSNGFSINLLDDKGDTIKTFRFTLLPAVQYGSMDQVPEVKPGILLRASNNIKSFILPGGNPVFQCLGLKPTILQLVGLIVGSEEVVETQNDANQPFSNSKGISALYNTDSTLLGTKIATYFREQFVQSNRPVEIVIVSGNTKNSSQYNDGIIFLSYRVLIEGMREFIARQDRVYYSLECLVLDYPTLEINK